MFKIGSSRIAGQSLNDFLPREKSSGVTSDMTGRFRVAGGVFVFSLVDCEIFLQHMKSSMRNGLSGIFGPPFTKHQNYLLSCNATVAKGIMLCSQHVALVA